MQTDDKVTSQEDGQGPSPESHLDTSLWRHALIPWKPGGREYTYLVAPGVECQAGFWAMVLMPNGKPNVFQVASMQPHEPTTFQCKPIANCWSDKDYQEMVQAAHPDKPTISMHPDYPQWLTEVADMFVEGR